MREAGPINWTLRRSGRARKLWVTVRRDGAVVVTAPHAAGMGAIERFVREQAAWIARAVARMRTFAGDTFLPRGRREYLLRKEEARGLVQQLLAEYAPAYGLRYRRVSIKDMTRNWGSCSELGNLNFNYKLVFLPRRLAAYVVAHELCHLAHFDHSPAFWALVAKTFPDHRALRKELRRFHA
jgi:predicted metal-dependent hydrolase